VTRRRNAASASSTDALSSGGAPPAAVSPLSAGADAAAPKKRVPRAPLPDKYERVLDFNPHSSPQVLSLIRSLGLKPPRSTKGEDRETTEAKYLKRFGRKHPVFRLILQCRERQKLLSTYNWKLSEDGRVKTTYGFHPSTLRKSSRAVNLQNIPKRSDLATEFRRMLVATPGHLLIEADASAIEAVLVGYCANSQRYIHLARAGVHGWLTSHIVGTPIDAGIGDADLGHQCQSFKRSHKAIYEVAKRIVHLSNYMGSPQRIWDEYEEEFQSLAQVKELQQLYFSLIPDVVKWQHDVCQRAAKEKYLENHFRYRHYFYNVFQWDRRSASYKLGDDAKRAVAFIPQSDASAIQSELLLRLDAYPDLREHLRLVVHDSVVLEVPEQQVPYVCSILHQEMVAPIPELGNLSIGAEVRFGPSLADMEVWNG
jgi:DNA polymerase I-like protein with 3'-5' exonuclease and polymerase domains